MGIHLMMYRINGILLDGNEEYLDLSEVHEHDSDRYFGDTQFINFTQKTYHPVDDDLWRPKDIDYTIELAESFREQLGLTNRLPDSLRLLKANEDYWFKTSY
jgi:predicted phosphohydrolase